MTLKVGDRVLDPFSKKVVTVTSIDGHEHWPVQARYDDGTLGRWHKHEVEKIDDHADEMSPLGLQPGDKVVNLKTGREGLVLKGPVSGELKVYDQKPPIRDAVPARALEEYEFHYPGTYDVWRRVTAPATVQAQPW